MREQRVGIIMRDKEKFNSKKKLPLDILPSTVY